MAAYPVAERGGYGYDYQCAKGGADAGAP